MTTLEHLSRAWVKREKNGKYKPGRATDQLAFEFMVGACEALHHAKHPEADHVTQVVVDIIAVRGADELRHIAAGTLDPVVESELEQQNHIQDLQERH